MKISILLPLGRDEVEGQRLIDKIHGASNGINEIQVCVSTFTDHCYENAQTITDDRAGAWRATVGLLSIADGDIVVWLSDVITPEPSAFDNIAAFLREKRPPIIAEFWIGDGGIAWNGYRFARWGATTRETINMLGPLDNAYGAFWGDIDYAVRCWKAGGVVEVCNSAVIRIPIRDYHDDALKTSNMQRFGDKDWEVFYSKWGEGSRGSYTVG